MAKKKTSKKTVKKKATKKTVKKKGAGKKTAKKKTVAKEGLTPKQVEIMEFAVKHKKPFAYGEVRDSLDLKKGLSALILTGENSLVNQGYLVQGEALDDKPGRVSFSLTAKGKKFKA